MGGETGLGVKLSGRRGATSGLGVSLSAGRRGEASGLGVNLSGRWGEIHERYGCGSGRSDG